MACIKTASGERLARCERVLNNPSWRFLSDGCPIANLITPDTGLNQSIAVVDKAAILDRLSKG